MILQAMSTNISQTRQNPLLNKQDCSFQSNIPMLNNKSSKDLSFSRSITDISLQQFNTKNSVFIDQVIKQFTSNADHVHFSRENFINNAKMQKRSNNIDEFIRKKPQNFQRLKQDRYWYSNFDENMFKMFESKKSYQKHLDYLKKQKKKSEEMFAQFHNESIKLQQNAFTRKVSEKGMLEEQDSKLQHDIPEHQFQKINFSSSKKIHHNFDFFVDQTDKPHDYNCHEAMQFIQDQWNGSQKLIKNVEKFKSPQQIKSKKNIQLQSIKQQTALVLDQSLQELRYTNMRKDYEKMMNQFRSVINEYRQIQDQQNHVQRQLKKIDDEVRRHSLRSKQLKQRTKAKSSYEGGKPQANYRQLKELVVRIKTQNRSSLYNTFNNQIDDLQSQLKKAAQPLTFKDYPVVPCQFSERKSKSPLQGFNKMPEIIGYKSHNNLFEVSHKEQQINFLQFKSEMLNEIRSESINVKTHHQTPKVYVLDEKQQFKKKQYLSPFQVRILSPKADFSKKSPYVFPNFQKNQKPISALDQNNQDNVFQNGQIKVNVYFSKNSNLQKPITAKIEISNKCFFEIQNIFAIVFGPGGINIESEPKRVFFNCLNIKRKAQFMINFNTDAINSKQFSLQITYIRSGVKRKAHIKIKIPINYLFSTLSIDEVTFLSAWEKIEKEIYIPIRRLQISQTQWRQRVNLLFDITQLRNSKSKLLYQQIASFKYAQFPPIFFMKIQYAIGNKVGIRMKIAPKPNKHILEEVMDIINSIYQQ